MNENSPEQVTIEKDQSSDPVKKDLGEHKILSQQTGRKGFLKLAVRAGLGALAFSALGRSKVHANDTPNTGSGEINTPEAITQIPEFHFTTTEELKQYYQGEDEKMFPSLVRNNAWKTMSREEVNATRKEQLNKDERYVSFVTTEAWRKKADAYLKSIGSPIKDPTELLQKIAEASNKEKEKSQLWQKRPTTVLKEVIYIDENNPDAQQLLTYFPQSIAPRVDGYSETILGPFPPLSRDAFVPIGGLSGEFGGQPFDTPDSPIPFNRSGADVKVNNIDVRVSRGDNHELEGHILGGLSDLYPLTSYNIPGPIGESLPYLTAFKTDVMGERMLFHTGPLSELQAAYTAQSGFRSVQAEQRPECKPPTQLHSLTIRFQEPQGAGSTAKVTESPVSLLNETTGNTVKKLNCPARDNNIVKIDRTNLPEQTDFHRAAWTLVEMQKNGTNTLFPLPRFAFSTFLEYLGKKDAEVNITFLKDQKAGKGVDFDVFSSNEIKDIDAYVKDPTNGIFAYTEVHHDNPPGGQDIPFYYLWSQVPD